MITVIGNLLHTLESEHPATRKCVERIPFSIYEFKPHPRSMQLGYLVHLVCDIPRWIATMIEHDTIDLQNYKGGTPGNLEAMVKYLDDNVASATAAFNKLRDDQLEVPFSLVSGKQLLSKMSRIDFITNTIGHWIHHRGQLTVYMRLNEIAVPSIYGPSADENTFKS